MTPDLDDRMQRLMDQASRLSARKQLLEEEERRHEGEIATCEHEEQLLLQVVTLFRHLLQLYVYSYAASFSDVVTEGLRSIFEDQEIDFRIDVEEKRNKIQAKFVTTHGGVEGDVLESFGGGVSAIQSLLLRILVLLKADLAPYLFLDESLAALSKEYVPHTGEFLRQLCQELGIHILLVTHQQEFLNYADSAYQVARSGDATVLRKIR